MSQLPYQCSMNALVAISLFDKKERDRLVADVEAKNQQIRDTRVLTQSAILEDVCQVFGYEIERVRGKRRSEGLVLCRRFYCYLCCMKTKFSLNETALELKCHHASVIYHRDVVKNFLQVKDSEFMVHWQYFIHNSKLFVENDF